MALQVGYANQVVLEAPPGVSVTVPDATHITISGADKQAVGQFAAIVRDVRPPEPYKGKGIRYEGEAVAARPARRSARSEITTGEPAGPLFSNRISVRPSLVEDRPVNTANHQRLVQTRRLRRQRHVRNRLTGTPQRPRLAVFRSPKHIYAQINDETGTTLVSASTMEPEIKAQAKYGGNKAAAVLVGRVVAEGQKAGIDKICFDRRSYKYHGCVAALAQPPATRDSGFDRSPRLEGRSRPRDSALLRLESIVVMEVFVRVERRS